MNRLAKPADGSDGLVGSRNDALLRRFNLAVAPRPWGCKKIYETESVGVPSILFLHQHLLHTVQPLPSSSSSVYPQSQVLQIAERLYQTPASHHCQRNYGPAGFLRSLGVTAVHRYCKPFRHPLAFLPFPGSAGYRSDLLQSISLWDEEGFSRC